MTTIPFKVGQLVHLPDKKWVRITKDDGGMFVEVAHRGERTMEPRESVTIVQPNVGCIVTDGNGVYRVVDVSRELLTIRDTDPRDKRLFQIEKNEVVVIYLLIIFSRVI